MLLSTDRGAALHPNCLMTHIDPAKTLFSSQYSIYPKNGFIGDLPAQNFHEPGIFLQLY